MNTQTLRNATVESPKVYRSISYVLDKRPPRTHDHLAPMTYDHNQLGPTADDCGNPRREAMKKANSVIDTSRFPALKSDSFPPFIESNLVPPHGDLHELADDVVGCPNKRIWDHRQCTSRHRVMLSVLGILHHAIPTCVINCFQPQSTIG